MPLTDTIVMVSTIAVVLATHNLAPGVLVGVLLSCVFFARKVGKLVTVNSELDQAGRRRHPGQAPRADGTAGCTGELRDGHSKRRRHATLPSDR